MKEEGSTSFFEKKEAKKLLIALVRAVERAGNQIKKSFLLLFFKKEVLPLILLSLSGAQAATLHQTEKQLDAANQAAQRHEAAATAALAAANRAKHDQAALVTQEIAATAALRATENKTARIAAKLALLTARTAQAHHQLHQDEAAIAPLLPLIARLALHPAATLLVADAAAGRAAEGALIMRGLTREIATHAAALHRAARHYATLSTALTAERAQLTQAIAVQQAGATALQSNIAAVAHQAAIADARHETQAAAAARAAATAHDLVAVIGRLQQQRRAAARARAQAAAARIPPSALPHALRHAPVAGRLVHGFGAATAAGPATGDTFAAPPGAIVSAACTGQILFARPFQSYGKLLILDCGHGYDFVMAGFHRFDVKVGQSVRAGQPVGALPGNPENRPRLYVELRHHGTAIDPAGHFSGEPAR